MSAYSNLSSDITVTVADTGILIHQGFLKQALFISREHVQSFVANPLQTPVRVITPFAATALTCYAAMGHIDRLRVEPSASKSDEFALTIRSSRGCTVTFLSDASEPIPLRLLSDRGVDIVITPMCVARVDASSRKPSLTMIATIPVLERPEYARRFAAEPKMLVNAVVQAVRKTK